MVRVPFRHPKICTRAKHVLLFLCIGIREFQCPNFLFFVLLFWKIGFREFQYPIYFVRLGDWTLLIIHVSLLGMVTCDKYWNGSYISGCFHGGFYFCSNYFYYPKQCTLDMLLLARLWCEVSVYVYESL